MKSSIIAASALLMASAAMAAKPHAHQHQHQKHHEKREVVWEFAYEVVTETIPITTTIWVAADEVPATTSSTSTDNPGQFYETPSSLPAVVVPTTSSTPSTLKTSSTSASAALKVASSSPQPQTSSTPAPVVVAPSVAPAVASTVASSVAPASSAVTQDTTQSVSSSGYSGVCSAASPCTGDITYYEAGLGACGDTDNGNTTRIIALPYEMMGTQSNGNPFCGMTVTITKGSKSTVAHVADKCMGCVGASIDLSNLAFSDLEDFSVGRTTATWHFN